MDETADITARAATLIKSNLVALGSAAVLTIYSAGFMKTRAAAERFAQEDMARRRPVPTVVAAPAPVANEVAKPDSVVPVAATTAQPVSSAPAPEKDAALAVAQKPDSAPAATKAVAVAAPVDSAKPKAAAVITQNAKTPDSTASAKTQVVDPAPVPEKPKPQWKDGIYKGYGTSRHGDIEAEVEIKGGRIVFAMISRCLTQYSCSVFDFVVPQVVSRQSAEVDYVSGATQSVNAFYYAVMEALGKAK